MSSTNSESVPIVDFPDSVEEAAALLGATITLCGKSSQKEAVLPPTGMHPAFAVTKAASELISRLYILRAMLRTAKSRSGELPAAPSILQVLKKLLGVSTSLAAVAATASVVGSATEPVKASKPEQRVLILKHKHETPPMLSTPCRELWVDCVVLCFAASPTFSDLTNFVRQMLALASIHPRSAKAAGGVRIAALAVVAALFEHEDYKMASQLAPWSLDVLQVCLKALRSAGNGEPTYREAAIRAACATATACQNAAWKNRKETAASDRDALLLQGAMEDKAVAESIKVLRQAVTDKFPEIRTVAATFAAALAPLLVPLAGDYFASLDEVLMLATKNLDDESPVVADGWAEALARCMSTAIQYNESSSQATGARNPEGGAGGSPAKVEASPARFGTRKATGLAHSLDSVKKAVQFLVIKFVKAGGEAAAPRGGGSFSVGGRAVRLGYCVTLSRFLRLQSVLGSVGESRGMSYKDAVIFVLAMVGTEMDKLLKPAGSGENAPTNPLFGGGRSRSRTDAGLARLCTSRVLRHGITDLSSELVQISILQEYILLLPGTDAGQSSDDTPTLNANQIQVILNEVSHILGTLGEAAASRIEEIVPTLKVCLSHEDLGVRHEAAILSAALTSCFPSEGRKFVSSCVEEIQQHHAQIVTAATADQNKADEHGGGLRMFRRAPKEKVSQTDSAVLQHQFAIHGRALMVSVLVKDMSRLPGGLSREFLGTILTVAEILVSCQFNDILTSANADAVCSCVRAGFCLVSGVLTSGPDVVETHMPLIVGTWQKAVKASKDGAKHTNGQHDLMCIEAVLCSMVAFLQFCSELLLTIPEALSQMTVLLEDVFPLIKPTGRFSNVPVTPLVAARLESTTASLLEAFAWLPSGSFPIIADEVFSFAAVQIQKAVEEHVPCSILHSLVSREDSVLDSKTLSRAKRDGQLGGARDIEESIIALTAEVSLHDDRESVMHLRSHEPVGLLEASSTAFRGSSILELFASDTKLAKPPTPLHEVGTWRRPLDPSGSSRIRIVDAAIQAFSAVFGLKDGKEQQGAMNMLESLVPPLLTQLARTVGINASLAEQDWRAKGKEDSAAEAIITAVLLSCLQALPLHEATHNVPIGLGPPWMNKAKDLLLTLLPSTSTIVRRAAAEGLALLATLGVTEDAHFLQSTLLHSLDEVMQGNKPDGKPRAITLEPISAARAGSLLTLACIQRTAYNVAQRKRARARGRSSGRKASETIDDSNDSLPVLQMMTRILPSASCHGFSDYFAVKTYALYSFAVLLLYSDRLNNDPLGDEDKQLLRKAIELVEDNFASSWTATSADMNRGQEAEKMTSEVAFLSVLLRLMTFLVPFLQHLVREDRDIARRFSVMATTMIESNGSHPVIFVESMAFFEVLASHQHLLPSPSRNVVYSENPTFSCVPSIMAALTPIRPVPFAQGIWRKDCFMVSTQSLRSAIYLINVLASSQFAIAEWSEMKVVSLLMASLEAASGTGRFGDEILLRSVAASREVERLFFEGIAIEKEIFKTLPTLLLLERTFHVQGNDRFLRWILLTKQLLSPSFEAEDTASYTRSHVVAAASAKAASDVSAVYKLTGQPRWQVKCLAAQVASEVLCEIISGEIEAPRKVKENPHFDLATANKLCAKECAEASDMGAKLPCSKLVFHFEDVLSAACMSSVATLDHAELRLLQESSMRFLQKLIVAFGSISDPEEPTKSILDQYATQIFSSIKHALAAPEQYDSASSSRLFVAGCEALNAALGTKIATDPMLLTRLLRPTVPSEGSLRLFSFSDGSAIRKLDADEGDIDLNTQASVAILVGKLWIAGKFLLSEDIEMKNVAKDLIKDRLGLAVNCAAAAVDGCRLLVSSNLSLVGKQRRTANCDSELALDCGFHHQNGDGIDDFGREMLAMKWSSCGSCSLEPLLDTLTSDEDENRRELCSTWIKSLYPLFIAGIRDGIFAMSNDSEDGGVDWARGIDASLVVRECLSGMNLIVSSESVDIFDRDFGQQLKQLVELLRESVFIPSLCSETSMNSVTEPDVVLEVCNLICHLAASNQEFLSIDSCLLVTLLEPLNLLQTGNIEFADTQADIADIIISSCLTSVASLLRQGSATDALVKAVLQLVLKSIVAPEAESPPRVQDAGKSLLVECLKHQSVSMMELRHIARNLASSGNWEAWSVISTLNDGKAITHSLEIIQKSLRFFNDPESQIETLAAIRSVIQKASAPVVGLLLHNVGADVLTLLYNYGTMKIPELAVTYRTAATADAMKILLTAYKQISAEETEEQVSTFLSVLFETLLAVLRFNGLPNHSSPETAGDPALGRISAQTILHVARTSPVPFKTSVATLSDHDRTLLEFAVRAEMSGYAKAPQQAPAKKKLSLKGFKS